MKIKCVNCSAILSVDREQLKKAEKPLIICCGCQQKMLVQPQAAICGHCNEKINYYEYQLNSSAPYLACQRCKSVNKVPLNFKGYKKIKEKIT